MIGRQRGQPDPTIRPLTPEGKVPNPILVGSRKKRVAGASFCERAKASPDEELALQFTASRCCSRNVQFCSAGRRWRQWNLRVGGGCPDSRVRTADFGLHKAGRSVLARVARARAAGALARRMPSEAVRTGPQQLCCVKDVDWAKSSRRSRPSFSLWRRRLRRVSFVRSRNGPTRTTVPRAEPLRRRQSGGATALCLVVQWRANVNQSGKDSGGDDAAAQAKN